MISLFSFGIMGGVILLSWFADLDFNIKSLIWACIVLTIVAIGGFVLSLSRRFAGMAFRFLDRLGRIRYLGKIIAIIEKLYKSYQLYREHKGVLFLFFLLTCLENLLPIIRSYIIAIAFSAAVPLAYFFVIVPIELILVRLPLSLDGFGIREGIFVFFLSLIGISTEVGFSVGLTNHLVFLIALLPGGVFYLLNRERSETILTVPGSPGRAG